MSVLMAFATIACGIVCVVLFGKFQQSGSLALLVSGVICGLASTVCAVVIVLRTFLPSFSVVHWAVVLVGSAVTVVLIYRFKFGSRGGCSAHSCEISSNPILRIAVLLAVTLFPAMISFGGRYISMATALGIAFLCARKYKKLNTPSYRVLAGAFASLSLFISVTIVTTLLLESRSHVRDVAAKELHTRDIAMEFMGDYLGDRFNGHGLVIITDANTDENKVEIQRTLKGLESGLDGRLVVLAVESPFVPHSDNAASTTAEQDPQYSQWTAEVFDRIIRDAVGCDLVLSFIGLPANIEKSEFWNKDLLDRPKLVVISSDMHNLGKFVENKKISTLVSPGRDLVYLKNNDNQRDAAYTFHSRYLLLDNANLKNMCRHYPHLYEKANNVPTDDETEEIVNNL